jgi:hypothetical protein
MACADCCRCRHEPPPGIAEEQAKVTQELASIAGTQPMYSTRGHYQARAYPLGYGYMTLASGSAVKANVWKEALNHDGTGRMVSLDASLTVDDARVVFAALWGQRQRRTTKAQPKRKPRRAA